MLFKMTFGFILFFSSVFGYAGDVVQGPFKVSNCTNILVEKSNDENYPLILLARINGKEINVDRYESDGSSPTIESIFFQTINGVKNILVLVSWQQYHREENINGRAYQTFGYVYNSCHIKSNPKITNDKFLSGIDGTFGGEELKFKYNNSQSIKDYIRDKF